METLLVYEEELQYLFRRCQKCGQLNDASRTHVNKRDGSQFTVHLHCWDGCDTKWQSQPSSKYMRGLGNLDLTTAIFFAGICFVVNENCCLMTSLSLFEKINL